LDNTNIENNIQHVDIIVLNALILTMDNERTIIENGKIVINNGKIAAVGEDINLDSYKAKKTIDAKGKLVMPGLINTHTHASMTMFRGIADDITLKSWLYENIFPLEAKYVNSDFVRLGTQLAVLEMLHSGTTTFNDMYYYEDEVAKAAKEIGIRAVINEGLIDFSAPNSPTSQDGLNYTEYLLNKWKDDSHIKVGVAVHAPYSCSDKLFISAKQLADKYNTTLHFHLTETKWEVNNLAKSHNCTPVEYLDSLGILDENSIAAHCVHLTESDIETIAMRKLGVAHNPQCNMKIASGVAPVPALLDAKVTVGIGTDGPASNNNHDMFEEINTAALLHKLSSNNPLVLDAATVVSLATVEGAKLLKIDNITGSIEIGKRADLLIIDLNKPHLVPLYNIYSQIVYSMNGSDVESVIVDGKLVMENKKVLNTDEELIIKEVKTLSKSINKNHHK